MIVGTTQLLFAQMFRTTTIRLKKIRKKYFPRKKNEQLKEREREREERRENAF